MRDAGSDFHEFEVEHGLPREVNYDISQLESFCGKDPDCFLTFYGGEPLLCIHIIKEIMDHVKARHFSIQTNGLLLNRLKPEYLNRLQTIFVSIDGDESVTDSNRGRGTLERTINNMVLIKENGFQGELIARMTVMENVNIYKQVRWLLNNEKFSFSSVHWQLNAGFWNDFARRDFARWTKASYNPGIRKLVKFWVQKMEDEGKVLRLYPFLGVAQSFLLDEKVDHIRCGAGWMNYGIQTDGHIIPCPSMWGMRDYYLGHISHSHPLELEKISLSQSCTTCDIFDICGGRCLYANIAERWSRKEYAFVCETVRNLINSIGQEISKIRRLICEGRINLRDFEFVKYAGCEVIP